MLSGVYVQALDWWFLLRVTISFEEIRRRKWALVTREKSDEQWGWSEVQRWRLFLSATLSQQQQTLPSKCDAINLLENSAVRRCEVLQQACLNLHQGQCLPDWGQGCALPTAPDSCLRPDLYLYLHTGTRCSWGSQPHMLSFWPLRFKLSARRRSIASGIKEGLIHQVEQLFPDSAEDSMHTGLNNKPLTCEWLSHRDL